MIDSKRAPSNTRQVTALAAVLLLLLAIAACGGSAGSPAAPLPSSGAGEGGVVATSGDDLGTLEISMQDAPIDDVSEVWVFVTGLRVKPDGRPVESLETFAGPYDLLRLRNGVSELLVADRVLAGRYQFIEILLDQDQSYVVETATGERRPVQIPSQKVKLAGGPFDVFPDRTTSVLFDFDVERSLKRKGNGEWQLKPFVSIIRVDDDA
jgi:hypothetical protein